MFGKGTYLIEIDTAQVEAGFNKLEQRLQRLGININGSVKQLDILEDKFKKMTTGSTGQINSLVSTIHNLNKAISAVNRQAIGQKDIIKSLLGNYSPTALEKLPGRVDRINNSLVALSRIGTAVAPGLQTITSALNSMATALTTVDIRLGSVVAKLGRIPTTAGRIYSAAGPRGERSAEKEIKRREREAAQEATKRAEMGGLAKYDWLAFTVAGAYAFKTLTTAAFNFGKTLIDTKIQFEKYTNTFKAIEGTTAGAQRQLQYITQFSKEAGLNLQEMATAYSKFLAAGKLSGANEAELRKTFEVISRSGQVLGLSGDEMNGAFQALQQMISKGKVTSEELRQQLAERIPGAMAIAARAMNMTGEELSKALEQGLVSTKEFLPAFTAEMEKSFGKSFKDASNSTIAEVERMKTAWLEFKKELADSSLGDTAVSALRSINRIISTPKATNDMRNLRIRMMMESQMDTTGMNSAYKIDEAIRKARESETYLSDPSNVYNLQNSNFGGAGTIQETIKKLEEQKFQMSQNRQTAYAKAVLDGKSMEDINEINKILVSFETEVQNNIDALKHHSATLSDDAKKALDIKKTETEFGSVAMQKALAMDSKAKQGLGQDKTLLSQTIGLAGFGKEEANLFKKVVGLEDKAKTQLEIINAISEAGYKQYLAATDEKAKERLMEVYKLPFDKGREAVDKAIGEMADKAKIFDTVEYKGLIPTEQLKAFYEDFKRIGDKESLDVTIEQYSKQLEGLSLEQLAKQVDRNLPKDFIEAYRNAFEEAIKKELDKDLTSEQLISLGNTRKNVLSQITNTKSQDINVRTQEQWRSEYENNIVGAIDALSKNTILNRDQTRDLELAIKDMISESELKGMSLENISKIADFIDKKQKTKDSLIEAVGATDTSVYDLIDKAKAGTLNKNLAIKAAEEQIADLVDKQLIDYNEYLKMTDKLNSLKGDGLLKTMKERELLELQKLSLSQLVDLERQRREMGDVEGASLAGEAKGRKLQSGTFDSSSFTAGMKDAVAETQNLNQVMYSMGQNTINTLNNGFTEMYQGIIDGSKSAGESFRDMGNLIISQMLAMLTQALIVGPLINAALGMAGGFAAGGGAAASGGGMVGGTNISGGAGVGIGVAHTGGVAGQPTFTRYHTGGMVSGDEVPIIAKSGEKVVSQADQMKEKQNTAPTFINIVDPVDGKRVIAENPDAIINVIAQNKNKIKNLLR